MARKVDRVTGLPELQGWVPIRFYWKEQQPTIDWCYMGRDRFIDPFFNQTIELCLRRRFNLLFRHQTSTDVLSQWAEQRPGLLPSGFIFHMSRCGSTLVSQMLASLSDNIVISEAGLIDSALRARSHNSSVTDDERAAWLKWIVSALGQPRAGTERRLFIKFDAWTILDFDIVRRAFPTVPWLFLYRDPIEVLVSQLGRRAAHMIPGVIHPETFGIDYQSAIAMSPEEYCARILAGICDCALQHRKDGGFLLNYTQLPDAVVNQALDFFGVNCSSEELEIICNAAKLDAKNPALTFENDSQEKQKRASGAAREAAATWLYPVYEKLEAARHSS